MYLLHRKNYTMRLLYISLLFTIYTLGLKAQIVSIDPPLFTIDEEITVIYDATQGSAGLVGVTPVYAHTGVITASGGLGNWQLVQGNWGTADPKVVMAPIGNDRHLIQFVPRDFYGIPENEEVLQLSFVFRNQDGSKEGKTTSLEDIFIDVPDLNAFTGKFITPDEEQLVLDEGETIAIRAAISMTSDFSLFDNDVEIFTDNGTELLFEYTATEPGNHVMRFEANNGNEIIEDSFSFVVLEGNAPVAAIPMEANYGATLLEEGSVLLRLFAPDKAHVFALTNLTNYRIDADFQMTQTPDGNDWWIIIDPNDNDTELLYQYLVDGRIKIADPYSTLILDQFNDDQIPSALAAVPVPYPVGLTSGHISYVDLNPVDYPWQNTPFEAPANEDLVIYELLIRDFLADHSFDTLIDTLNYLKDLGVNAIELMPVSEFENNDSWGYNPSYHMALDKYYGSPESFKAVVDAAHGMGMAVILDIVYNHAFGQSPLVRLYWDSANSRPSEDSPYFNPIPKHPFNVGFDFNHNSAATQTYTKQTIDYWLDEFKVDGFRFDLSKGFTQKFSSGDASFSALDQDRINTLTDYGNHIWQRFPASILILEHFASNTEETALADNGFLLWGNANFNSNEATMGYHDGGKSDFGHIYYPRRGWTSPNLIGYMESHDEERLMYKNINFGNSSPDYNVREKGYALQRNAMTAAFFFAIPGPKMLWQFGELGYDFSINTCTDGSVDENCRLARKPIRWDYQQEESRMALFQLYQQMFRLKSTHPAIDSDADVSLNLGGATKTIVASKQDEHLVIIGNFDVIPQEVSVDMPVDGIWFDYLVGNTITTSGTYTTLLGPGEYHIYLSNSDFVSSSNQLVPVEDQISMYPNPGSDQLNFATTLMEPVDLIFYNSAGTQVMSAQNVLTGHSVDVSRLNSGIYFVQVLVAGGTIQTLKLMISN
jgi:glycosidase